MLYLLDDSGADDDSNMASPSVPMGLLGLHAQTHKTVETHSEAALQLSFQRTRSARQKHIPPLTASRAPEHIHATVSLNGLSKHRQAKDQQRGKKKGGEFTKKTGLNRNKNETVFLNNKRNKIPYRSTESSLTCAGLKIACSSAMTQPATV